MAMELLKVALKPAPYLFNLVVPQSQFVGVHLPQALSLVELPEINKVGKELGSVLVHFPSKEVKVERVAAVLLVFVASVVLAEREEVSKIIKKAKVNCKVFILCMIFGFN